MVHAIKGSAIVLMDTVAHHAKKLSIVKIIVQTMDYAIKELAIALTASLEITVKV